ncbi:uncharacterized protein LOC142168364 [Nicotiana tabacum]|uniref:Uncharacterized protein LOC142168364 n=1 Tax=Nicotiana tabacum TaxID=4097 RepID=A0AC58SJJ6_TOBAC
MKLDMQKAYDSIEWPFMEQVLNALAFPDKFVKWVMTCMETVTYTVMINGNLTKPFEAKKGLRQGDPMSPFLFVLAMEYLTRSLKTLNQIPDFNYHPKGDIGSIKLLFQCFMEFSNASGLMINKHKISIFFGGVSQADQEEILELLGIQKGELPTYWAQVFVLPKKITKLIEAMCRSFLWTGEGSISKKALLAWEKVCLPKSAGGFNIMNIAVWNKAAICKLRGRFGKVSWRRIVFHNTGCPQWTFILTVAAHGKLYTKDRLHKWGLQVDQKCVLCNQDNETIHHLFFECTYAKALWSALLPWQIIRRPVAGWDEELQWAEKKTKRNTAATELYKMAVAATVYHVWQERNTRIFQAKVTGWEAVSKKIIQEIHCRSTKHTAGILHRLDWYPV